MPVWLVAVTTLIYMFGLFYLAWKGDIHSAKAKGNWQRSPYIYSLALGVYCTSWTFFGAVGSAATRGLYFLPIYIGPIILYLFWPSILERIASISKRESINSLSDFLASRYGRSRSLAAVCTATLAIASFPYIALQLKSVGMSFQAVTQFTTHQSSNPTDPTVLFAALFLGLFAILYGARNEDATHQNFGLMNVLAFEAIVKLVALMCVAVVALMSFQEIEPDSLNQIAETFDVSTIQLNFFTTSCLSLAAILCLPRQFHVSIIERRSVKEMKNAKIVFPLYLVLTSLVIFPIAIAGLHFLPDNVSPDLYVILLPQYLGLDWLTLLVFIGGFSAASGMIVVAAIALSTMITNDLIVPLAFRFKTFDPNDENIGYKLLNVRRTSIFVLLLLGYFVYEAFGDRNALMDIGLISFVGVAQLFPSLIGAIYWRSAHRDGAMAGIILGVCVWVYTLVLPAILGQTWLDGTFLSPTNLFQLIETDSLTHGVCWSLLINTLSFCIISLRSKERLRDRVQANVFREDDRNTKHGNPASFPVTGLTVSDLQALASRFLKPVAVDSALQTFAKETGVDIRPDSVADWRLIQRTERLLSSALGASSARVILESAITQSNVSLDDVLSILDEKSDAKRFDRHLLQATLENISLGVSVVDGEQRLVAWNSAYVRMFELPDSLARVGCPIEDIIRWNAERGECGPGEIDRHVSKRLAHIVSGRPHIYERKRANGTVLKTIGNPMPGGGYVTTFTDITEDKRTEQRLREAKDNLESRVRERTLDLEEATKELDSARMEAIGANASKTRFLAAASHDLLQPLNAARLFTGALQAIPDVQSPHLLELVGKVDKSIQSADQLIRGLLDISKLDHGGVPEQVEDISLSSVFADIVDEIEPIAAASGLKLVIVPTKYCVRGDVDYLKSIIRNFVSNALRYTQEGGVVIGARKRDGRIRIEVWDSGPGIPDDRQSVIFEEFQRIAETDRNGVRGAGLGLAISKRMAGLMGAEIGLRSVLGRGSIFYVDLEPSQALPVHKSPISKNSKANKDLTGMKILCVDDEDAILDAMSALLKSWGCTPFIANSHKTAAELIRKHDLDFALIDYQIDKRTTGFDILDLIEKRKDPSIPAALLTADRSKEVMNTAEQKGIRVFTKPVSPNDLFNFLANMN